MIELDATIRAMGLYKYIIYAFERAAMIAAINYNKERMRETLKDVTYYRNNIIRFARQLRDQKYESWTRFEESFEKV